MDANEPLPKQLPAPTTYTIGGVKVEFPTKAYPSQLAMMNKVIQGLKHKQNCLLESPTGSGKSLALLCATLAWQRHEAARAEEYNAAIDARAAQAYEDYKRQKQQKRKTQESQRTNQNGKNRRDKSSYTSTGESTLPTDDVVDLTETDDEDFKPIKRCKSSSSCSSLKTDFQDDDASTASSSTNSHKTERIGENETLPGTNGEYYNDTEDEKDKPFFVPPEKKMSVPKIYFGTRTHKQIAQITRELRKTVYVNARSVILASRDHTCINPLVEKSSNKNESCKELLDTMHQMNGGCGFHQNAKKFGSFAALPNFGVRPGYDLEDLVEAGRSAKSCPYYASRYLSGSADIIFCPYNYLIDPFTRKSMMIELDNQVVIFDEGHNMEDASREAASFTINQDEIQVAMQDCEKVSHCTQPHPHLELAKFLCSISAWMDKQEASLKSVDFDNSGKCWSGTELVASLAVEGIDETRIKTLQEYFKAVMTQKDKEMELAKEQRSGREGISVTSGTSYLLEVVFRMFNQLNQNGGKNRDDFRLALLQTVVRRRRDARPIARQVKSFNFWCLNPAIAFQEVTQMVHCIILTSGTLSPIQSFQSELGTPFPIKLEASHVIDKNQVWAGVVGVGPTGTNLNGAYKNAETLAYQDELGNMVFAVCDEMPHGILCFLPSYRMLENLESRWKATGTWDKIAKVKAIFTESRSGNADFQDMMHTYYDCVAEPMAGRTGALFIAVCRGKVSEGLDFADQNARAVICIGIPFPNYRDMQVEHKREYNDKNRGRGLLSGAEWYEIQAFRALNQALGRCIRHRFDWGAILLVDDRYCKTPRYVNSLSKWVRSSVQNFSNWPSCISNMSSFRCQMANRMQQQVFSGGNGFDLDVSVGMEEFHLAPRDVGTGNENVIPSASGYRFLSNRQNQKAIEVKANPNHPLQFDDDDDDGYSPVSVPTIKLDSQGSDEKFIIRGNSSTVWSMSGNSKPSSSNKGNDNSIPAIFKKLGNKFNY